MTTHVSPASRGISLSTIRRLPRYLRLLQQLAAAGQETVSSNLISEELGQESIVVRKDLAVTGVNGKPRIGFHIPSLIRAIEDVINLHDHSEAFLVGVGNLGTALMGYQGFAQYGLNIVAAFDTNPEKIGVTVHGKRVFPLETMIELGQRMHVIMGILCVPAEEAQDVTNIMVKAGIRGIWNFTPMTLKVPEGIVVQREDIAAGLAVLSVKLERLLHGEFVKTIDEPLFEDEAEEMADK